MQTFKSSTEMLEPTVCHLDTGKCPKGNQHLAQFSFVIYFFSLSYLLEGEYLAPISLNSDSFASFLS